MRYFIFLVLAYTVSLSWGEEISRKEWLAKEINRANAFIKSASLRQEKYAQMKESPFTFYRASAHIYYQDLKKGTIPIPMSWQVSQVNTWIQGDSHLQNIGFFDNSQKLVTFSLNDFDESYLAPFYWDNLRFLCSVFLAAEEFDFPANETTIERVAFVFCQKYFQALAKIKDNNEENTLTFRPNNLSKFVAKEILKLEKKKDPLKLLDKWTILKEERSFDFNLEKLEALSEDDKLSLELAWSEYLQEVGELYQNNPSYFQVKDLARRLLSGLGSLGVKKYYFLIEGPSSSSDDDIILQVKEQKAPSLLLAQESIHFDFKNQASRAKFAYQAMQNHEDKHLGTFCALETSFLVNKISPWKSDYEGKDFNEEEDLHEFLSDAATVLAYCHSRADQDHSSSHVPYSFDEKAHEMLKNTSDFNQKIIELARDYHQQVEKDYQLFLELLEEKKLP